MIALRVGYEDAEILATHFRPSGPNAMAPRAFSDLSQYEAWARNRYGEVSDPIRITTLPRLAFSYGERDTLIQHSRDRFATKQRGDGAKDQPVDAALRRGRASDHGRRVLLRCKTVGIFPRRVLY